MKKSKREKKAKPQIKEGKEKQEKPLKPQKSKIFGSRKSKDFLGEKLPKEENGDKLEKQVIILLAILICILAGFFILNYSFRKPYFEYQDFKVYRVKLVGTSGSYLFYSIPVDFWVAGKTEQKNTVIKTDPRELDKMDIIFDVSDQFLKTRPTKLWLTVDPYLQSKVIEARFEIGKFAGNLDIPVSYAFTHGAENKTQNIARCEDATDEHRVIELKMGEGTIIYTDKDNPSCVIVEFNSYDNVIQVADKYVMEWLLRIQN